MYAKPALVADLMAVDPIVVRIEFVAGNEGCRSAVSRHIRQVDPGVDGDGALVGVSP